MRARLGPRGIGRLIDLDRGIYELEKRSTIGSPYLRNEHHGDAGVGALVAARILAEVGNVCRFPSRDTSQP
jgi:hypothetical protein